MAVDVYTESLVGIISPRLSFSNDIEEDDNETTKTQIPCSRLDHTLVDSTTFEFAFNVDTSFTFQPSTADELFSDGKILPTPIKNEEEDEITEVQELKQEAMPCLDRKPPRVEPQEKKKSLKEFLEDSIEDEDEEPNMTAKSFWKFRRSNSLNCDRNRNQKKGLIGSKILSRSGSTGKFLEKIMEEDDDVDQKRNSVTKSFWKFRRSNNITSDFANGNANGHVKGLTDSLKILRRSHSTSDHHQQHLDKIPNVKPFRRSSSLNCDSRSRGANHGLYGSVSGKPLPRSYSTGSALKKEEQFVSINAKSCPKRQGKNNCKGYGYGNYSNKVRVSPVLNLPSPYISRVSVDLFGIGSLFCNGSTKDRKKKK